MIWRVIIRGAGTLQEIETFWDLIDLLDANDALDLQDAADSEQVATK